MKKRFLTLFLCLALLFTGCNINGKEKDNQNSANQTTQGEAADNKTFLRMTESTRRLPREPRLKSAAVRSIFIVRETVSTLIPKLPT